MEHPFAFKPSVQPGSFCSSEGVVGRVLLSLPTACGGRRLRTSPAGSESILDHSLGLARWRVRSARRQARLAFISIKKRRHRETVGRFVQVS